MDQALFSNKSQNLTSLPKRRLKTPIRNQVEMRIASLDDMLPQDHKARFVWDFVEQLNFDTVLGSIKSLDGAVGRPATDPKILLALWLYATLEGIVSARTIDDYCREHLAYQWLCGGVNMNYHTISDFASDHGEKFNEWLTESVAIFMHHGIVTLEEVAQDGMRVRAWAGKSSFRKEKTLKECYKVAKQYLNKLHKEFAKNPSNSRSRKDAAKERAAQTRLKMVSEAQKELKKLKEYKLKSFEKQRKKPKEEEVENAKTSTTDPESRIMKMACGGFRPAYNVQFATDTKSRFIVGVDVNNKGNDTGLIVPMLKQLEERYGILPSRCLEDGGYTDYREIEKASELYGYCKIYMPIRQTDSHDPKPKDSEAVKEWKKRMSTEEAKNIYKNRSSTAEFSNAFARNRGLQMFLVKGIKKVRQVALRYALAHNLQRIFTLRTCLS